MSVEIPSFSTPGREELWGAPYFVSPLLHVCFLSLKGSQNEGLGPICAKWRAERERPLSGCDLICTNEDAAGLGCSPLKTSSPLKCLAVRVYFLGSQRGMWFVVLKENLGYNEWGGEGWKVLRPAVTAFCWDCLLRLPSAKSLWLGWVEAIITAPPSECKANLLNLRKWKHLKEMWKSVVRIKLHLWVDACINIVVCEKTHGTRLPIWNKNVH